MITIEEKRHLRDLAKQLKEITDHPIWEQKKSDWNDLMKLNGKRTMVYSYIFNDAWFEILHPSKILQIKDPLFRGIEYDIVKRIYRSRHFCADMIIYPDIYIPIEYRFSDWVENRQRPYGNAQEGELRAAVAFHPVLENTADIKKLKKPRLEYLNWEKTNENFAMVQDVLGDILPVHKGCPFTAQADFDVFGWGMSIIDVLTELRGLQQFYGKRLILGRIP